MYKECQCQGEYSSYMYIILNINVAARSHMKFYRFAGDSCSNVFLSTVTTCINGCYPGGNEHAITRLIPDVQFTCSGTVTKWKAAARLNTQSGHNSNTVLGIWRQSSSGSQMYNRISTLELGVCGSVEATVVETTNQNSVYECTLPESSRVTVQTGDIVGIEFANNNELRFALLFDNTQATGPKNYMFIGQLPSANLNAPSGATDHDIPQISLIVEPIVDPLTTTMPQTEASTTESITTTLLPTTFTINSNTVGPTSTTQTQTDTTVIESETTTLAEGSFIEDISVSEDVIVGAVAAVVVAIALLIAIMLVLAYLIMSRKSATRGGDIVHVKSQKGSDLRKELGDMEYNDAYIPRIPTKDNIAYGQAANLDAVVYDTIVDIEPGSSNTMTREVSVSNIYSSVS